MANNIKHTIPLNYVTANVRPNCMTLLNKSLMWDPTVKKSTTGLLFMITIQL